MCNQHGLHFAGECHREAQRQQRNRHQSDVGNDQAHVAQDLQGQRQPLRDQDVG